MASERTNICSDGVSIGHPRGHGTFPRVLGHYVREKKVMTLEQGVYKMTGLAAKHLRHHRPRHHRRGQSAPDLVLFDPATIRRSRRRCKPHGLVGGHREGLGQRQDSCIRIDARPACVLKIPARAQENRIADESGRQPWPCPAADADFRIASLANPCCPRPLQLDLQGRALHAEY